MKVTIKNEKGEEKEHDINDTVYYHILDEGQGNGATNIRRENRALLTQMFSEYFIDDKIDYSTAKISDILNSVQKAISAKVNDSEKQLSEYKQKTTNNVVSSESDKVKHQIEIEKQKNEFEKLLVEKTQKMKSDMDSQNFLSDVKNAAISNGMNPELINMWSKNFVGEHIKLLDGENPMYKNISTDKSYFTNSLPSNLDEIVKNVRKSTPAIFIIPKGGNISPSPKGDSNSLESGNLIDEAYAEHN